MVDLRRIYFDKNTGNKLIEVGYFGFMEPSEITDDINNFTELSERNRDTFDIIELPFVKYFQNFIQCNGYRVNVVLLDSLSDDKRGEALEFSFPDPNNPEAPQVFGLPLTEQIKKLQTSQADTNTMLLEFMEATLLT